MFSSSTLAVDLDQLAATGKALSEAQSEARTLLANTLQAAAEASTSIRGTASPAWAALLQDWQTQATAHKTQGEQLADGTTTAAKAYAATDAGNANDVKTHLTQDQIALTTTTHGDKDVALSKDYTASPTTIKGVDFKGGSLASLAQGGFTGNSLWATSGPSANDVHQSGIGDCYFDASMAAAAYADPDLVKKAISYDPATGNFIVQLYDYAEGRNWVPGAHGDDNPFPTGANQVPATPKTVTVTQADLKQDFKLTGASGLDDSDTGYKGFIWPAVMEAAEAKIVHDDYGAVADPKHSGYTYGSYMEQHGDDYTGKRGTGAVSDGLLIMQDGSSDQAMAVVTGHPGTQHMPPALTDYDALSTALANHQPVLMGTTGSTDKEFEHQVAHDHEYTVEGISKDANGNVQLTVRNPWGTNSGIPGDENTQNGVVTVDLKTELDAGMISDFDIGPTRQELRL